ncbi:MAG TPA: Uma2 family endonuclease [Pyrinomonadaceae bacterium]|nr:Uma2 family endonuclease [Pyrinomonadaceae bacterium]
MSTMLSIIGSEPGEIEFPYLNAMSDEEFFDFCQRNRDWRIERTREGDIIIMPPAGSKTGGRNFNLTVKFGIWAEQDGTGIGFDSSTGFRLPNGAIRSPDLAWVRKERWEALSEREQTKFAPLCPDFVVELRSATDSVQRLQEKMQEYVENGAGLGWLIDPTERKVYIYRKSSPLEILDDPQEISGEPTLPGFSLDMRNLWD